MHVFAKATVVFAEAMQVFVEAMEVLFAKAIEVLCAFHQDLNLN